ncbi:MAG: DMT family transporter [Candidatus Methylopumilus sp.]
MKKAKFYMIGFSALMLCDTLTQVSFKLASNHGGEFVMQLAWFMSIFSQPWIYGAVLGYLGSFVAWMTLLKHAPVGPAFAASHLEVVLVLVVSAVYFGDRLAPMQVLGALLIVIGIICLSLSEAEQENVEVH